MQINLETRACKHQLKHAPKVGSHPRRVNIALVLMSKGELFGDGNAAGQEPSLVTVIRLIEINI